MIVIVEDGDRVAYVFVVISEGSLWSQYLSV
jgi:hypothetical protein